MQRRTTTNVVVGFLAAAFAASWMVTGERSAREPGTATNEGAEVVYLGSAGVVFQNRANTCGVAALIMVLDRYGILASQQNLEQRVRLEFGSASLLALRDLARSEGLEAEGWRLSLQDLRRIQLPAIMFIENHHFIVVDSIDGSGFLFVRDPSVGRLKIPPGRVSDMWKGDALVITRGKR